MAQLRRAADPRRPLGKAAEQTDQRELVDRQGDLGRSDVRRPQGAMPDPDRADRLTAVIALLLDLEGRLHPIEDPEQADPRRVDADAVDPDVAAGDDQRRHEVEGGR